jgi:hypothetical protein
MVLGLLACGIAEAHTRWILDRFWPDYDHAIWMIDGGGVALLAFMFIKPKE